MKVWIFNHYAITPEQTGGTRHYSLAKQLQSRGHEVTIIASNYDHFTAKHRHDNSQITTEDVDGIRFLWIPTRAYSGNGKSRALNMLDYAKQIKLVPGFLNGEKPDVIYGSSPHLFTPYQAQKLARRLGAPFVMEVRDVWPQTLIDLGNLSPSSLFIRVLSWMEKKLYRTAGHIVSLLPDAPQHCVNLGAKKENTSWIPNGIDLRFLPESTEPPKNEKFTITYAGSHGLANGLDNILEAAKLLKNDPIQFRLIGDGPDKQALIKKAKAEGVSNVEFCDPVPKSEIYNELQNSDAFVMLLRASDVFRWGVSPNKLFDYMAMARPIIFAVNSSNSPVEAAGCGLRIEPDNPQALADACKSLACMSEEERNRMGAKGRWYVEENHTFEVLGAKLETVLKSTQK
ncbi:MAG: glycosyltransferase family 4 protein [Armatimonadetes bacterium]|nr:glycosyltransferase family 4 protein [Armatimonadota bacterium]